MMIDENNNEKFNAIVESICYWLGYQFKIGRDGFIHEASLRYPIADTITAKGIAIKRIELEKTSPIFKQRYIDLVIFDETVKEPEKEKNDDKLSEVYEFKLAKNETSKEYQAEHQRVFNDIVRLAYYNLWNGKDCYFLMCGQFEAFKTYFVGQKSELKFEDDKLKAPPRKIKPENNINKEVEKIDHVQIWEPKGIYKDWFGFKIEEMKVIEFKNDNAKFGLKPFQKKYKIRKYKTNKYDDTIFVKTKCVAITNTRTHAAGIWKIESDIGKKPKEFSEIS